MRRELKNIAEYQKPSNDAFASVVRSFGEANSRFQKLAVESVERAVEIQSQFVGKAYDTYISEISKLGRMLFVGYRTFTAWPQELPYANFNEKRAADRQQAPLAEAKVNPDAAKRRTAAQSMTTKRKTGTVAKSQEIVQGEEESRFSPPQQRLASLGLVPSQFSVMICRSANGTKRTNSIVVLMSVSDP